MSTPKITDYAARLLARPKGISALPPRPVGLNVSSRPPRPDRQSMPYDPVRRAEHLRHARIWLKKQGITQAAYARAHGLSVPLFFSAQRFAKANPRAKKWPRLPIGCRRQISDGQLADLRAAYDKPTGQSQPEIARRIGVNRCVVAHYFRKWRAAE